MYVYIHIYMFACVHPHVWKYTYRTAAYMETYLKKLLPPIDIHFHTFASRQNDQRGDDRTGQPEMLKEPKRQNNPNRNASENKPEIDQKDYESKRGPT